MSKVKIQGNASGTGVVTLTAPNTNTDRTITLPDGDISLGVGIDDNATSTAITIDASENVGIGTSPLTNLHIKGSDATVLAGNAMSTNSGVLLQIENTSTVTGSYTGLKFRSASGDVGIAAAYNGAANKADMVFFTDEDGGNERMRILSAGGLTFNGDTAAANALDDYEEGTWTPAIFSDYGGFPSTIGGSVSGTYVKVGKVVTCYFSIDMAGGAAVSVSDAAIFTGIPFSPSFSAVFAGAGSAFIYGGIGPRANAHLSAVVKGSNNYLYTTVIYEETGGTAYGAVKGQFTYETT